MVDSGNTQVIKFTADENDLIRVLSHPVDMVGSDSGRASGKPHPRNYGTFPRVLARYVIEIGIGSPGWDSQGVRDQP